MKKNNKIRNLNLGQKVLHKKLDFTRIIITILILLFSINSIFSSKLQLEWSNQTIPPETWIKINLTNTYENPIVVATPVYTTTTNNNGISTWITNISTDSFMLRVSDENFAAADNILVNYMVVEEGNWTLPDSGIKIEAGSLSTNKVGSRNNGWTCPNYGETINFRTTFNSNPLVLSTRASDKNPNSWAATFKHDPASTSTPVGTTQMCIGLSQSKAVSPGPIIFNETINWIAIDEGSGVLNGVEYEILWNLQDTGDSGGNWINGYADPKPFIQAWNRTWTTTPKIILAGQTTVSGSDGSWPVIYDFNNTYIRMFVDEANERAHSGSESGGGVAFNNSGSYGNLPPENIKINFTKSKIFLNQDNKINATIKDANGNNTLTKAITTIFTPDNLSINISLNQIIDPVNLMSSDVENSTSNYVAQTGGDVIGETGIINLSNRTSKLITFTQNYSETPVVILTPITQNNDDSYPIPTIYSVNTTHANITLCRDNGAITCDNNYLDETIAYAVFDVNKTRNLTWIDVGFINATTDGLGTAFSFNKTFANAPYVWSQSQTYNINSIVSNGISSTSWLSGITTTGGNLHACDHPGTANACGGTAIETFGYVAIDVLNNNIKDFNSGSISISNSAWTGINFINTYNNPNVFVIVNSDNGNQDPKYPWARSITSNTAEIRYCEQDGINYCDTHTGEDTRWFSIENGLILTGNGGDDIERNTSIKTYQDIYNKTTKNISKITIFINITGYDDSASVGRSNSRPDLEIELKDEFGNFLTIGDLNISGIGLFNISIYDQSILKAFEQENKRDIKINAKNFDYLSSTQIDKIEWDMIYTRINYLNFTGLWNGSFTNTSVCGNYNLTDLYSYDNINKNHTTYNSISFNIPCNPIVNLISPLNNSKILGNGNINFTWYIESSSPILSCGIYINSILNQTINCSPFVNNSIIINLDSGYYNWTINATDQDNLYTKPDPLYFYNILNYSVRISKGILSENIDQYKINTIIENLINLTREIKIIEFISKEFNYGSFNKLYGWNYNISGGIFNGEILGWNLTLSNLNKTNINYSITKSLNNDYKLSDEYIIGLE